VQIRANPWPASFELEGHDVATRAEDLIRRHRYTVEDYRRMGEAGVLGEDDRVELIEGEIVDMTPAGSRHAGTVARLNRALDRAVGDHALVWVRNPIRLGDRSEPEPDLALLGPRAGDYTDRLPEAGDVLLVIEVSGTSQRYDREVKIPLYARHGVPEGWLVDLEADALHAFREPSAEGYRQEARIANLGSVAIERLPGVTLDVGTLFGT
jgi:Uma2 family endonuclease